MTLKQSGDLLPIYCELQNLTINEPEMLSNDDAANPAKFHKWKTVHHDHVEKRKLQLADNKRAMYMVTWGQCCPTMQSKIKSSLKFDIKNQECDIMWLLKEIQLVMFKFNDHSEPFLALDNVRDSLLACKQEEGESVSNILQQFQSHVDSFGHYGGAIGGDKGLMKSLASEYANEMPKDLDHNEYPSIIKYTEAVKE